MVSRRYPLGRGGTRLPDDAQSARRGQRAALPGAKFGRWSTRDAPILQKPWTTSAGATRLRAVLDGPLIVPLDSPVTHDQHRAG
jgi:hypothetical protein